MIGQEIGLVGIEALPDIECREVIAVAGDSAQVVDARKVERAREVAVAAENLPNFGEPVELQFTQLRVVVAQNAAQPRAGVHVECLQVVVVQLQPGQMGLAAQIEVLDEVVVELHVEIVGRRAEGLFAHVDLADPVLLSQQVAQLRIAEVELFDLVARAVEPDELLRI